MKRVPTKKVVKTLNDSPEMNRRSVNSGTSLQRSKSSGIAIEDLEAAQSRLAQEREQYRGSVLSAKRKRSNTLKVRPTPISLKDEYVAENHFKEHKDFVTKVKFHPNSRTKFYSSGNDGEIIFYDLDNSHQFHFIAHELGIIDFDVSQNGKYLVSVGWDSSVKLWSLSAIENDQLLLVDEYELSSRSNVVLFNPMHINQFLIGDENGKILLFTGKSKLPIQISNTLPLLALWKWTMTSYTPEAIRTMIFSSNGKYLITGNVSGTIMVYEQSKNPHIFTVLEQTALRVPITGLAYNSAEQVLLVASCDHKARLFNCPDLTLKKVFFHQQETYSCKVALSADGKISFVTSEDYHIHVFNNSTGSLITKWQAHDTVVSGIDVRSSDLLLSSSYEGHTVVWHCGMEETTQDLKL